MREIKGDPNQKFLQIEFLSKKGINIENGITLFPKVASNDWKGALTLLWLYSVPGWWHYENEYVNLGIKTQEQIQEKLNKK